MSKRSIIFFIWLIFFSFITQAAKVDTVSVFSNAMQKQIKCIIIKPSAYKKKKLNFPVVYLLHGYAGNYSNWITKVPAIKQYADEHKMIIVCPDGEYASWYFDSPIIASSKYETFISKEVPHYIDSVYRTIADKDHRAITGLSMGGHGALFVAWRHAVTFGAAGSMSGVFDLIESKNKYQIIKVLGDTLHFADNWKNYSVVNVVETKTTYPLTLIIDDGIEDIFIAGNRRLHQKLLLLKIPHEYIERPGKHDWNYWANAVKYQLYFFNNFFSKKKS
jgi:S-formylglutathione hydrolase FrmB